MKPVSASASATSRWPTKEPPKPCKITTSGRSRPAMGQSFAARTVTGPTAISPGGVAHGYQTPPPSAGPASDGTSIREKPAARVGAAARTAREDMAKFRIQLSARIRDHLFRIVDCVIIRDLRLTLNWCSTLQYKWDPSRRPGSQFRTCQIAIQALMQIWRKPRWRVGFRAGSASSA